MMYSGRPGKTEAYMAISIDVRYYVSVKQNAMFCYLLKVVAESAVEMPKEIFIFQRNVAPAQTANAQPTDQFTCLADPVDLEEIPVDVPDLLNEMPYYRSATVDLLFRDMITLEETKTLIAEDIQILVNSLKAATDVQVMEEVTYA
jgi:hypothetical protein